MASGVAIGTLIGICFALGWAIAGLQGVPRRWRALGFTIALIVSVLLGGGVLLRLRLAHSAATPGSFDGVVYGWAIGLESVAIVVTAITLQRGGLTHYLMPAIAFIVGAHFFGLARAMTSGGGRVFIWVGVLMCMSAAVVIWGLARSLVSSAQSAALTGFSCAFILWGSALSTLI